MRRKRLPATILLLLLLLAAAAYQSGLRRWLPGVRPVTLPAPAPAGAAVEGPYFSDSDRVAERVLAAINRTKKTLDVAIYDLTHPDITAAIESAHRRGVEVRIVADQRQSHEPHSEIPYLISRGVPVRLSRGYKGNRSIMHNKFAVFDGRTAVTGSFNWTTSADSYNFENALFVSDPAIVARFQAEFERIWGQAR